MTHKVDGPRIASDNKADIKKKTAADPVSSIASEAINNQKTEPESSFFGRIFHKIVAQGIKLFLPEYP